MSGLALLAEAAAAVGVAALRWTPLPVLALLVARRRGATARQRHAAWAAALLALALMLPASALLPGLEVPLPAAMGETGAMERWTPRPGAGEPAAAATGPLADAPEGVPGVDARRQGAMGPIAWVWLAGALALAGRELLQIRRTRRLVREAREAPSGATEDVRALGAGRGERCRTADLAVPAVAGVLRPHLLLPATWGEWPPRWRRAVLLHEAAHLERRDLAWQALGRWLRVAFWFHPGVWMAVRRAACEAEAACDEQVVAGGVDRLEYARVLLEVADAARRAPLPASALGAASRPSQLGERVRRLLAPGRATGSGRRLGAAALLACGLGLAAARPSLPPGEPAAGPGSLPLRRVAAAAAAGESGGGEAWMLRCAAGDERCAALNATALRALEATGLNGVAVVTRATDGRIEAYAARGVAGGPQPGVPAAAPGSLAKLALAAAWWERGGGERLLPCPPVTETTRGARVAAVRATAHSLAPRDVLAFSCNTAAAAMAAELARERGAGALQDALAPLVGTTSSGDAVADWELQAVGIGPLETDPLRVAAFLHAVAGDGLARQPWAGSSRAPAPRRLFAPATAAALRAALAAAVERGTARPLGEAQRGQGWRLTGKTGTVAGPGERVDGWFAALASDEAGRAERAVVVWLQGGGSGGGRPARLALELARAARR